TPASYLARESDRWEPGAMSEIHHQGGSTMSTDSITTRPAATTRRRSASGKRRRSTTRVDQPAPPTDERALPQLRLGRIVATWAAAAVPMGLLAWVIAPLLADQLSGASALP